MTAMREMFDKACRGECCYAIDSVRPAATTHEAYAIAESDSLAHDRQASGLTCMQQLAQGRLCLNQVHVQLVPQAL